MTMQKILDELARAADPFGRVDRRKIAGRGTLGLQMRPASEMSAEIEIWAGGIIELSVGSALRLELDLSEGSQELLRAVVYGVLRHGCGVRSTGRKFWFEVSSEPLAGDSPHDRLIHGWAAWGHVDPPEDVHLRPLRFLVFRGWHPTI
jgi:hypothetical protein